MLFKPTSKKLTRARVVVIITHEHVINWDPFTPIFLPKNPETIEPNKGNDMRAKYILFKFYCDTSSSFSPFSIGIYLIYP
jgi:hypothetical protein